VKTERHKEREPASQRDRETERQRDQGREKLVAQHNVEAKFCTDKRGHAFLSVSSYSRTQQLPRFHWKCTCTLAFGVKRAPKGSK
jgi:hypothetical protein